MTNDKPRPLATGRRLPSGGRRQQLQRERETSNHSNEKQPSPGCGTCRGRRLAR
ncbi:MAG: hypothetical protein K8T91_00235 [Planctomycetes bacterium]|nr:hypothetical protein [Planctomycetota bacterium]